MTDIPILFSAPMVRALLAGTKTQTRRLRGVPKIEPTTEAGRWHIHKNGGGDWGVPDAEVAKRAADYLPIWPGDRLWVRETWRPNYGADGWREDLGRVAKPSDFDPKTTAIEYLADGTRELGGNSRPGIHMPRWASRLTLIITESRVQRLQDISEEDAQAEGVEQTFAGHHRLHAYCAPEPFNQRTWDTPREAFADLWQQINGKTAPWRSNPWVAAYTFTVHRCNVDEAPKS